jgi:hypothetical protein
MLGDFQNVDVVFFLPRFHMLGILVFRVMVLAVCRLYDVRLKLGVMAHVCNPAYSGGRGKRIAVWDSMRPYLNQRPKNRGWCLSGRAFT